jgi:hypothetical protein
MMAEYFLGIMFSPCPQRTQNHRNYDKPRKDIRP